MSVLKKGDEKYHYSDGSHKWVAPSSEQQEAWTATLEAHMTQHREDFGGRYLASKPPVR